MAWLLKTGGYPAHRKKRDQRNRREHTWVRVLQRAGRPTAVRVAGREHARIIDPALVAQRLAQAVDEADVAVPPRPRGSANRRACRRVRTRSSSADSAEITPPSRGSMTRSPSNPRSAARGRRGRGTGARATGGPPPCRQVHDRCAFDAVDDRVAEDPFRSRCARSRTRRRLRRVTSGRRSQGACRRTESAHGELIPAGAAVHHPRRAPTPPRPWRLRICQYLRASHGRWLRCHRSR